MFRILITLFLLTITLNAQHKFAWITDMQIGYDSADVDLEKVVAQINTFNDISFIVASGDITEKSKNSEFDKAKRILDELEKPLLIVPGTQDLQWSNSGGAKFVELWDEDKFIYKKDSTIYIGMNSAIPMQGGGGHFKPEDIEWLKDELSRVDTSKEIIFISHHPLNDIIDNWFLVTNLLRKHAIKVVLNGYNHKTEKNIFNGIPSISARSTSSKDRKSYGFVIVENIKDSLNIFEVEKDTIPKYWGSIDKQEQLSIEEIDSTQLINYSAKILFQKNIKSTLIASPLFVNEKIFIADYTGLIRCYNLEGRLIWDYDTFGDITGKPSFVENKLIVSTVQGELTILDANNGEQIETIGFDEYLVAPPVIFNHEGTKNLIIPKLTQSNSAIIIASASGKVFCYDLETLQEIWTNKEATDMIGTAPQVIGNQIIFGSRDSHLYSIDANSGTTIWKWKGNESFYYSPAVCTPVNDGKYLYFATPDKVVHAVDIRLGTTKWESIKNDAWESIGISDNKKYLYIKSVEDKFHIILAKNGKLKQTVNVNYGFDTMTNTPIEWNDKIVFTSKNGYLYRINNKYWYKSILFLGTARLHSVQKIDEKRLMASNMDGEIIIFNIIND
jgi:outer membrane protein assembly factor BamB